VNRRLFLGGFLPAPLWSAAPLRLSRTSGQREEIDPAQYRATVLLFLSTVCPVSNAYQDRIHALVRDFAGEPVRVLLINANDNETAEETARYAADVRFSVPVYKDCGTPSPTASARC
jgi:uncharacterized protein YfaS (alpha-2-macroglobulin family)